MTDTELSALETAAKAATPGPWEQGNFRDDLVYSDKGAQVSYAAIITSSDDNHCISAQQAKQNSAYIAAANPATIFELIAELRQTKKERDWLARIFGTLPDRECPPNRRRWSMECRKITCVECWLQAAKEATCQK